MSAAIFGKRRGEKKLLGVALEPRKADKPKWGLTYRPVICKREIGIGHGTAVEAAGELMSPRVVM